MVIVWALSWWYGAGLKLRYARFLDRLAKTYDYFSIDLLAKTLFAPFRQISAGKVRGPLVVQWRAFVDRLVSRMIGAMIRSIIMIVGSVWITISALLGILMLLGWLVLPFAPVAGIVLMTTGWVPSWTL